MDPRRERLYRTEAVVIRRQDIGEADRLLTLYTPTMGKLRVVAKGARRPASRKAGHLELFIHSTLLVARGQSLDIVTQADTIHPFRALRDDLERITYAHYVVELLDRFTSEGQENRMVFELLVDTLQQLSEAQDLRLVVRAYEVHQLSLEGYQPELFTCVACAATLQPTINYLDPAQGGILCPRCGEPLLSGRIQQVRPIAASGLKVLRFLQTHDLDGCMRLRLKPNTHRDLEGLMLDYITYILERSLKSIDFLKRVRQEQERLQGTVIGRPRNEGN